MDRQGGLTLLCNLSSWLNARWEAENALAETYSEYISKDELALYDLLKTICLVSMFMAVLVISFGKSAKCAVWKRNPEFTRKVFKFSCFKLVAIALIGMYCGHLCQ